MRGGSGRYGAELVDTEDGRLRRWLRGERDDVGPCGNSGDEIGILAPGPQPRPPPAHALPPEDTPHLAARHLNATLLGGSRQRLERPLRFRLWMRRCQLPRQFIGRRAGRGQFDQGEDRAALQRREPRLAPRARVHSQPIQPALVESVQPGAHGLGMTGELRGDLPRAQSLPAARDQLGVEDPVSRCVRTVGEFAHVAFFDGVEWWASGEMFGHGTSHLLGPTRPHFSRHY